MNNSPLRATSTPASTPNARSTMTATRWVLVAAALVLAACAPDRPDRDLSFGPADDHLAAQTVPRPRPPVTPPPPDTRGVELSVVGGTDPAPKPVEIEGGQATLSGSLAFAGEPVVGATVRLERWVDGRMNWIELQTSESGGWMADGILGGRYVIRAWKEDRLALPQASAVFLAEDEERQVHLAMAQLSPPPVDIDIEDDDERADDEDADGDTDDGSTDGAQGADPDGDADDAGAATDDDTGAGGSTDRSGSDGAGGAVGAGAGRPSGRHGAGS